MDYMKPSSTEVGTEMLIHTGNSLTIETIEAFVQVLRAALAGDKAVAVEFEPEMEMDITAIQALCSACKTAVETHQSFIRRGPLPQALIELSEAVGCESRLLHCLQDDRPCFLNLKGELPCQK